MPARKGLYLISLLIQLAVAPLLVHDWDGFVFTRVVRDLLVGVTPYATAEANPPYTHLGNEWPPPDAWYAYPPLALLLMTPTVALAIRTGAALWLIRLAFKVPFILGTLGLAWIGTALLRAWGRADRAALWERLILLNPFLLLVSAVWGMFDATMVALLLLSALLLDRGRAFWAGVAFGASALLKLFPLFTAPAFVVYLARRGRAGRADAARFAISAAATFIAVSLPFFLSHPRGFVLQVLGMHLERPPQGVSLSSIAVEVARLAAAHGWMHGEPSIAMLSAIQFGATLAVIVVCTAAASRARSSFAFVRCLLGLLLGVLLTSKVLNEQYFVIPVSLYALVACASGARWARFGYNAFTIGALVAALLLGWHVFTFFPADVAVRLFGKQAHVMVGDLATASGLGPATFAFLPVLISVVALLPAFVAGFRRIVFECRAGGRILVVLVSRRMGRGHPWRARAAVALLLVTPILVEGTVSAFQRPTVTPKLDSTNRRLGVFYYLWWQNPSHDPSLADGNWRDVSEVPRAGYYSVNAGKLQHDFRVARSTGVDFVVTSFHEYDVPVLRSALRAAYDADLAIAPVIELGEIYTRPQYESRDGGYKLDNHSAQAIVSLTSQALELFATTPAAYRPGGKLAVFLYDSYYSGTSPDASFEDGLLDRAIMIAEREPRASGDRPVTRQDLLELQSTTLAKALENRPYSNVLRRAYSELYIEFWQKIRRELEAKFGPLFLVSGENWNPGNSFNRGSQTALDGMRAFDTTFIYSPSFVWVYHRGDSYERNWQRWVVRNVIASQYSRGQGRPVIETVMPSYDDRHVRKKNGFTIPLVGPRGSTYDLTWRFALDLSPDMVIVSTWNEFFEGSAIEPTVEHGDLLQKRTLDWSRPAHAERPPRKRGLILTGESSVHYAPGIADPSVEGRYAHNVQIVAERELPEYSFDAVDVASPDIANKSLSTYELVLLEPGLDAQSVAVARLVARLEEWVRTGGRLLASGVAAEGAIAALAGVRSAAPAAGVAHVTDSDGEALALPPMSLPLAENVADDAKVTARFADGEAQGRPAAWFRRVGDGVITGAAMHVTGRDVYPGADATALFCAIVRPLLAPGDRCANPDPDVLP
jgi:hypothetical protein